MPAQPPRCRTCQGEALQLGQLGQRGHIHHRPPRIQQPEEGVIWLLKYGDLLEDKRPGHTHLTQGTTPLAGSASNCPHPS